MQGLSDMYGSRGGIRLTKGSPKDPEGRARVLLSRFECFTRVRRNYTPKLISTCRPTTGSSLSFRRGLVAETLRESCACAYSTVVSPVP